MPTRTILALMLGMLVFSACAQNEPSPDDVITALITKAEQGDALAQYQLGIVYDDGLGVPENDKEAVRWFRAAADQGYAGAQNTLAILYKDGEAIPQNYEESVRWYQLAADQGHVDAQYNLGTMYLKGQGVPQNDIGAHMWFNLAASNGTGDVKDSAARNRDQVAKEMSPEDITEAQRLASEWRPKSSSK